MVGHGRPMADCCSIVPIVIVRVLSRGCGTVEAEASAKRGPLLNVDARAVNGFRYPLYILQHEGLLLFCSRSVAKQRFS